MRRSLQVLSIVGIILFVLGSAFYYCYVDRVDRFTERHDWYLHFTHVRLACRFCRGRVERLEYKGQPVAVPSTKENAEGQVRVGAMASPVGYFVLWGESDRWRLMHESGEVSDSQETISEEELARGYYRLEEAFPGGLGGNVRKPGTPEHWCLITFRETTGGYWISPELIGQAPWAESAE